MTDCRDVIEHYEYQVQCLEDRIEKLEAGEIEFDRIIGGYASENARFRDRIEKLTAALREIAALGFWDGDSAMSIASKALDAK